MGNWGYEPKEGDAPLDIFYEEVEIPVNATLVRLLINLEDDENPHAMWDWLGFLQLVLQAGIPVKKYTLGLAIGGIDGLLENEEFVNDWSNPKKFKASARRTQRWLKKVMDKMED